MCELLWAADEWGPAPPAQDAADLEGLGPCGRLLLLKTPRSCLHKAIAAQAVHL